MRGGVRAQRTGRNMETNWTETIILLQNALRAEKLSTERLKTYGEGLMCDDIEGGYGPESQYAWGTIVVDYKDVEVKVPDMEERERARRELQCIFRTCPDRNARKAAGKALGYGYLRIMMHKLF